MRSPRIPPRKQVPCSLPIGPEYIRASCSSYGMFQLRFDTQREIYNCDAEKKNKKTNKQKQDSNLSVFLVRYLVKVSEEDCVLNYKLK